MTSHCTRYGSSLIASGEKMNCVFGARFALPSAMRSLAIVPTMRHDRSGIRPCGRSSSGSRLGPVRHRSIENPHRSQRPFRPHGRQMSGIASAPRRSQLSRPNRARCAQVHANRRALPEFSSMTRMRNPLWGFLILRSTRYAASRNPDRPESEGKLPISALDVCCTVYDNRST